MGGLEGLDVRVWEALKEVGRPVHLDELAAAVKMSQRDVQHSIHRLVCTGYAIGSSSSRGYFVLLSQLDYRKAREELVGRKLEIESRISGLDECARTNRWTTGKQPDLFGKEAA